MSLSFLEQFVKYKESQKIALICENTTLTYAELYKRALLLAVRLRSQGVGVCSTTPEYYDIFDPKAAATSPWVVIISERCADAVIGIIATFMAGGAYVLMELDAPHAYLNSVVEDTAAVIVLRNGDFDVADEIGDFTYSFPQENEIACAIFTSGSTGKPKGAVLEHRVLNEMLRWQSEYMSPQKWESTAAYAPFSFIAALSELFFPLANGLTLHILGENTRRDLFALESYIEEKNISYMFLPPNIAEIFTQTYKGCALKYLRVAGGRLQSCGDPGGRYEIIYSLGMSENGGSVTFSPINEALSGDIPIGRAWNKTEIYLAGEDGEMAVSGPSLFRGYLSRRDETENRLVKNPYSNRPGYEKMYLSGDLARVSENGELFHNGRKDWIVKIRDMKVDPMQVEIALAKCSGVSECCVTSQTHNGDNILIGWTSGGADGAALRKELAASLPEYMIPSAFVTLQKLPRNHNGKIARGQLCYTEPSVLKQSGENMNDSEAEFATLFAKVLGISPHVIGAEDSFFALGGNSLKLMRLQIEIARETLQNIPYSILLGAPTPRGLAAALLNRKEFSNSHIPPAELLYEYPLSAPMRQMWLLWRTGQDCGKYTVSITCRFKGELDKSRANAAFSGLLRRNAILRSRFEERGDNVVQVIEENAAAFISEFPRTEFDLTATPLIDLTVGVNRLTFTTHHIIADAIGLRMLIEDFWTLYHGGEPQKSAQAHDVTMWNLNLAANQDESFWMEMFADTILPLALPCDFARPARLTSSSREVARFNTDETARLNEYASSRDATLFQLFLTGYALLLSELSGCESVVIGVPFAGRDHPDCARIIGMFVRTLPVRLDISGMDFSTALDYTRERFLAVGKQQDMSIERLAGIINVPRTASNSPFYDAMINYVPLPSPLPDDSGLTPEIERGEYSGALFDLVLDLQEESDGISAVFTYADELFKPETICSWAAAFKTLLLEHELNIEPVHDAIPVNTAEKGEPAFDLNLPQARDLLEVWAEVLGTPVSSSDDNFFMAGGTSLAAIRVESALFSKGWLLSAADIFQHPNLSDMAALMTPADEIDWEDEEEFETV